MKKSLGKGEVEYCVPENPQIWKLHKTQGKPSIIINRCLGGEYKKGKVTKEEKMSTVVKATTPHKHRSERGGKETFVLKSPSYVLHPECLDTEIAFLRKKGKAENHAAKKDGHRRKNGQNITESTLGGGFREKVKWLLFRRLKVEEALQTVVLGETRSAGRFQGVRSCARLQRNRIEFKIREKNQIVSGSRCLIIKGGSEGDSGIQPDREYYKGLIYREHKNDTRKERGVKVRVGHGGRENRREFMKESSEGGSKTKKKVPTEVMKAEELGQEVGESKNALLKN